MKLCMGCMEQYDDELTVCPHCGFVEDTESDNPLHMQTGTILAERYIIGKVIGYGGFGVTYIAKDVLLDVKVAVKEYLPGEFATRALGETEVSVFGGEKGEQFREGKKKFTDEAKKLAKFHSVPGIVKIFDSFEYNNTAYIIMELLEGETLAQMLKREKKIPEEKAVEMILPVIEALSNVHKDGIIHRDIAPDNIFVTKSGDVKLIDFGAARYATTTHSRSLTVIIKPGFSPEEQYRSRGDQGPHTDVYSVAATMYKMITGQTPPDAIERRAFFENKQKDILVPMTKYVKDIEENHEIAILNALNIKIEDRTPDMDTFFTELTSMTPVKRRAGTIKKIDVMRWPLWAKITVPTAAAVIVVFIILLATGTIRFGPNLSRDSTIEEWETRVPELVGCDCEEAEKLLDDKELSIKICGKKRNNVIAENLIINQDIPVGSVVNKNTEIKVYVSSGKSLQIVPNVIGMDSTLAKEKLESLDLKVRKVTEYNNVIAENCVIDQSIEPFASVEDGGEIVLTVSNGRDPKEPITVSSVTLPDFTGKTYSDALEEARKSNVCVEVEKYVYSKDTPKNVIISQSPSANKKVDTADGVKLVISLGFDKVAVPDVKYLSEKKAQIQLMGKGLLCSVKYEENDSYDAGVVLSQSIAADTEVDPETTVEIVVSKGSSSFEMPDVVGKKQDEARKLLEEKGLSVSISLKQDDSKKEDVVLSQSVKAGENVHKNDEIVLTVCTHSSVITVPNVVGASQSQGEKAITDLGLKVKINKVNSTSVRAGYIISQSPSAKSGVKKDTVVTLNVSTGVANDTSASSAEDEDEQEEEAAESKAESTKNTTSKNNTTATTSKKSTTTSKNGTGSKAPAPTPEPPSQPDSTDTSSTGRVVYYYPPEDDNRSDEYYTYYFLAPDNYFKTDKGAYNEQVGAYWWEPSENEAWPGYEMTPAPEIGENVFKIENVPAEASTIIFNAYVYVDNFLRFDLMEAAHQTTDINTEGYDEDCPYDLDLYTDNFDGWIYVLNTNDNWMNENSGGETCSGAWFTLEDYQKYDQYYGSYGFDDTESSQGTIVSCYIGVHDLNYDGDPAFFGAMNYEINYDSEYLEFKNAEFVHEDLQDDVENDYALFNAETPSCVRVGAINDAPESLDFSTSEGADLFRVDFLLKKDVSLNSLNITGECTSLTVVDKTDTNTKRLIDYENTVDYYTSMRLEES